MNWVEELVMKYNCGFLWAIEISPKLPFSQRNFIKKYPKIKLSICYWSTKGGVRSNFRYFYPFYPPQLNSIEYIENLLDRFSFELELLWSLNVST